MTFDVARGMWSAESNTQRGTTTISEAYREFGSNPRSCSGYSFVSLSAECSGILLSCAKSDHVVVTGRESQLEHQRYLSDKKLTDQKEPPTQLVTQSVRQDCANKLVAGHSMDDHLQRFLALKQEKSQKLRILARKGEDLGTKQRKVSDSAHNKETSSKKNRDANNRPVDEEKLQYLYKNAARWDVAQYRSDLKDAQYEFPQKKLDRIRLMSEDQKMEYIEALHKDNKYIGDLAVEARSGQQRLAAENEFLKQKLEDMQKKLDMMQALYARKLK